MHGGQRAIVVGAMVALLILPFPSGRAGAQEAPTMALAVSEILGFSLLSPERLSLGVFSVTCDFVPPEETLELVAQEDEEVEELNLTYRDGRLAGAATRNRNEPVLIFDVAATPPDVRWEEGVSQPLPPPDERQRRLTRANELGAAVRTAFGLAAFRGRNEDVARVIVRGRAQITVSFRSFNFRGASYVFVDPLTEAMLEVLNYDDLTEQWVISVTAHRLAIQKTSISGLTTRVQTATWDGGRWQAEEVESRPDRKATNPHPLATPEAGQVVQEAKTLLLKVRQQFHADGFAVDLAKFANP